MPSSSEGLVLTGPTVAQVHSSSQRKWEKAPVLGTLKKPSSSPGGDLAVSLHFIQQMLVVFSCLVVWRKERPYGYTDKSISRITGPPCISVIPNSGVTVEIVKGTIFFFLSSYLQILVFICEDLYPLSYSHGCSCLCLHGRCLICCFF